MYYYEHTNGNIIEKPDYVVDTWGTPVEYFDSPCSLYIQYLFEHSHH